MSGIWPVISGLRNVGEYCSEDTQRKGTCWFTEISNFSSFIQDRDLHCKVDT